MSDDYKPPKNGGALEGKFKIEKIDETKIQKGSEVYPGLYDRRAMPGNVLWISTPMHTPGWVEKYFFDPPATFYDTELGVPYNPNPPGEPILADLAHRAANMINEATEVWLQQAFKAGKDLTFHTWWEGLTFKFQAYLIGPDDEPPADWKVYRLAPARELLKRISTYEEEIGYSPLAEGLELLGLIKSTAWGAEGPTAYKMTQSGYEALDS